MTSLNRAVGHIEDTALPGADGNSGIAGHRDGFFRGLKDIGRDDAIELETRRGKEIYRVERIWIVEPEDISVLDATATRFAHAGDVLPVLSRRPGATTFHRPRREQTRLPFPRIVERVS